MATRAFRTPESYQDEHITRNMLPAFLSSRGFEHISDSRRHYGNTESQTIQAISPEGQRVEIRVRLCWRRGRHIGTNTYSAAQLLSSVDNDDWDGSINRKIQRDKNEGVTHYLFVQRENDDLKYAALVPSNELLSIWTAQRDTSAELIRAGRLGRSKKNHAMNGSSPTLYLQDDRATEVAQALWSHEGVRDLVKATQKRAMSLPDDEADRKDELVSGQYRPQEGDYRDIISCQIRERRGQQSFRDSLRLRFQDRCVVTGARVLAVLEAAHIKPYRGESDNHPANGLLLRSDIHTLFDLDLLGINPNNLEIELHQDVMGEYVDLAGQKIHCTSMNQPSSEALRIRYEHFLRRRRVKPT